MKKAYTLIEILIGISLVGVLLAVVNVLLASSLGSSRKSDSISSAETEGKYAMRVMEQGIKFARSVICTGANPTNSIAVTPKVGTVFNYLFANGGISSSSAALTSARVVVIPCSGNMFTCNTVSGIVSAIDVCFSIDRVGAGDVTEQAGSGGAGVMFQTRIPLMNVGN